MGIPTRQIKLQCKNNNVTLPQNKTKRCAYCLSYHIKGVCNSGCGSSSDHAAHTAAEDDEMVQWCKSHYKAA